MFAFWLFFFLISHEFTKISTSNFKLTNITLYKQSFLCHIGKANSCSKKEKFFAWLQENNYEDTRGKNGGLYVAIFWKHQDTYCKLWWLIMEAMKQGLNEMFTWRRKIGKLIKYKNKTIKQQIFPRTKNKSEVFLSKVHNLIKFLIVIKKTKFLNRNKIQIVMKNKRKILQFFAIF